MDREVYNRAIDRIAAMRAELLRLEDFVAMYRQLAGDADEPQTAEKTPVQITATVEENANDDEPTDRPRATPQAELERVVEQVLVANGAPMQRKELLERVKALGVIIGGQNETTNFGSKLSRAARLVNLARHGYWPKDQPYEPGGYQPGSAGLPVAA